MSELDFKDTEVTKVSGGYVLTCRLCEYSEVVNAKTLWKRKQVRKGGCVSCRHTGHPMKRNTTPDEKVKRLLFSQYKVGSRVRSMEFELSFEEFCKLVSSPCHYCGDAGSIRWDSTKSNSLVLCGVDRKDPQRGYSLDNCVPACTVCNRAKRDMPYEDFLTWVAKLTGNFA